MQNEIARLEDRRAAERELVERALDVDDSRAWEKIYKEYLQPASRVVLSQYDIDLAEFVQHVCSPPEPSQLGRPVSEQNRRGWVRGWLALWLKQPTEIGLLTHLKSRIRLFRKQYMAGKLKEKPFLVSEDKVDLKEDGLVNPAHQEIPEREFFSELTRERLLEVVSESELGLLIESRVDKKSRILLSKEHGFGDTESDCKRLDRHIQKLSKKIIEAGLDDTLD